MKAYLTQDIGPRKVFKKGLYDFEFYRPYLSSKYAPDLILNMDLEEIVSFSDYDYVSSSKLLKLEFDYPSSPLSPDVFTKIEEIVPDVISASPPKLSIRKLEIYEDEIMFALAPGEKVVIDDIVPYESSTTNSRWKTKFVLPQAVASIPYRAVLWDDSIVEDTCYIELLDVVIYGRLRLLPA